MSHTLVVNHRAKTIPGDKWRLVAAKTAYDSVQIMQDFGVADDDGNEQHGTAGDYIVQLSGGEWVIVPRGLYERLFKELA
jgi:hypothetical protein